MHVKKTVSGWRSIQMIEFLSMGKHTAFVYIAYIFSIVVLLLGYYLPHYALKKEIRIKNDKNNKDK